jgi:hypothetical protein
MPGGLTLSFLKRRPRIERVVVLGCGPAGIFAAHAAAQAGKAVVIYSRKRRSEMYGAQYLHSPIPGLTTKPPVAVDYTLIGTAEEYAQKVYGDDRPSFVSPASLLGEHKAWDIREAYYEGWTRYYEFIVNVELIDGNAFTTNHYFGQEGIWDAYNDPHTQIVSTIPAPSLCMRQHQFKARKIWAAGEAPERGQFIDFSVPANTIICNGEVAPSWYRASNIFGYKTIEWPFGGMKPPVENITDITKVISTNCDCWLPKVWRAGRQGTWDKSVLSHHAYNMVAGVFA